MQLVITGSENVDRILTPLLLFSVPVALILLGGRSLMSGAHVTYMGTASKQWTKIPATITASSVVGGLGLRNKKCRVNVEYRFTVGGNHFRGQTLQYGQPLWARSQADKIVDQYPIGKVVDAFLSAREAGNGDTHRFSFRSNASNRVVTETVTHTVFVRSNASN